MYDYRFSVTFGSVLLVLVALCVGIEAKTSYATQDVYREHSPYPYTIELLLENDYIDDCDVLPTATRFGEWPAVTYEQRDGTRIIIVPEARLLITDRSEKQSADVSGEEEDE